jgi:hypothetical protein
MDPSRLENSGARAQGLLGAWPAVAILRLLALMLELMLMLLLLAHDGATC